MFILDNIYYKVQVWHFDLPSNMTQATLYSYFNEDDMNRHENSIDSVIYSFEYDPSKETFEQIEGLVRSYKEAGQLARYSPPVSDVLEVAD